MREPGKHVPKEPYTREQKFIFWNYEEEIRRLKKLPRKKVCSDPRVVAFLQAHPEVAIRYST